MQRVPAVPVLAAVAAIFLLICLPGCGGGNTNTTGVVSQLILTPTRFL